jgi:hypothetical protein
MTDATAEAAAGRGFAPPGAAFARALLPIMRGLTLDRLSA